MNNDRIFTNYSSLDTILHFLLREADGADEKLQEIEKILDPFWEAVETLYPQVDRNDDRFFLLVTGLVSDIEDASYKLGFLQGFSLAQEIENTHPFG